MSTDAVEILPRSFVERIARIAGPASAAAQALAAADSGEHGTTPVFVRPVGGHDSYLMVTAASNLEREGEREGVPADREGSKPE